MPVETKTFSVDGDEYEITSLGAKQGRKIWLRLMHAFAPALKELGGDAKLNEKTLLSAIAAAVENLDDETTEALYEAFGESCTVLIPSTGNRPKLTGVVFDQHFARRYFSMSKWLWECVSYNFASFLGDTPLGSITSLVKKVAESRSKSPTDSIGSSGES